MLFVSVVLNEGKCQSEMFFCLCLLAVLAICVLPPLHHYNNGKYVLVFIMQNVKKKKKK